MNTLTDQYWNKYEGGVYYFCHGLLGKESEAVVACAEISRLFFKRAEAFPELLESEENVKSFLTITTRDHSLNRLRYLQNKPSWKVEAKRTLKNMFLSIMNMKPVKN